MSNSEPLTDQVRPKQRRRWFRVLPARALVVVAALALLVVGAVAGALLFSPPAAARSDGAGITRVDGRGPGPGLADGRRGPAADGPRGAGPGRSDDRGPAGTGPAARPILLGTVVSTGDGSLVVTPDGAAPRTLRTDDRTRVEGARVDAVSGLQPGQRVAVTVSGTGDTASAAVVRLPEARVTGTVTAVAGDLATVIADDGLVVTVNSATTSPKPAVGDVITVTGSANGTTISATTVTVLPKAS